MTKLMPWREDWAIGIATIDDDHRMLADTLMDICLRFCPESSAGRTSAPEGELLDALDALGERVRAHFQREEAFMRAIGYERLGEHVREHAVLMGELKSMLRDCRDRDLRVFDDATHEIVHHWLLAHILGADRAFADAYFRICGTEPRTGTGG